MKEKVKIKNMRADSFDLSETNGKFSIQVESCSLGKDIWLNGIASYPIDEITRHWEVGSEVEIEITNGRNFKHK